MSPWESTYETPSPVGVGRTDVGADGGGGDEAFGAFGTQGRSSLKLSVGLVFLMASSLPWMTLIAAMAAALLV